MHEQTERCDRTRRFWQIDLKASRPTPVERVSCHIARFVRASLSTCDCCAATVGTSGVPLGTFGNLLRERVSVIESIKTPRKEGSHTVDSEAGLRCNVLISSPIPSRSGAVTSIYIWPFGVARLRLSSHAHNKSIGRFDGYGTRCVQSFHRPFGTGRHLR